MKSTKRLNTISALLAMGITLVGCKGNGGKDSNYVPFSGDPTKGT